MYLIIDLLQLIAFEKQITGFYSTAALTNKACMLVICNDCKIILDKSAILSCCSFQLHLLIYNLRLFFAVWLLHLCLLLCILYTVMKISLFFLSVSCRLTVSMAIRLICNQAVKIVNNMIWYIFILKPHLASLNICMVVEYKTSSGFSDHLY